MSASPFWDQTTFSQLRLEQSLPPLLEHHWDHLIVMWELIQKDYRPGYMNDIEDHIADARESGRTGQLQLWKGDESRKNAGLRQQLEREVD